MATDQMLLDTAERIFADHCDKASLDAAEVGEYPTELHATLADNGFMELARRDSGRTACSSESTPRSRT